MALTPDDFLKGGFLTDRYGRRQVIPVTKNEAPLTSDLVQGDTIIDADGREQIALVDRDGDALDLSGAGGGGGGSGVTEVNGEDGIVDIFAAPISAATDADLQAHISAANDAHAASAVGFTPAAGIAATTVQAAIQEDAGDLAAHLADTSAAHGASAISFTPVGTIAATDVQAALAEVAAESGAAGTVTAVNAQTGSVDIYASPISAATAASVTTAANDLAAHLADTVDAHDASAVSFVPTGSIAATTAQAAIAEVASEAATALSDHLADGTDAHDASAISFVPAGTIAATTVQAAIEEVATEASGGGAPSIVTSLPGSPTNLQVIRFQVTAGAIYWDLMWVASVSKWVPVGGAVALEAFVANSENRSVSASYGTVSTSGPSITVPTGLSGVYQVTECAKLETTGAGSTGDMSFDIAATGAVDADRVTTHLSSSGDWASVSRTWTRSFVGGAALVCMYKSTNAVVKFGDRYLGIRPKLIDP